MNAGRHRAWIVKVAVAGGVAIALVGLGFVALHRTRSASKGVATASIHETVTTAPKVRTRKFQAEVVKTKDAKSGKTASQAQPRLGLVSTRASSLVEPSAPEGLALVETSPDSDGILEQVTTQSGNYRVLSDDDLVRLLGPRGAILVRDSDGAEQVIFAARPRF